MKTCPACGTQYSNDLSFCLKDGNRLSGGTTDGLTNNPTEPLPPRHATARQQDISTQETVASHHVQAAKPVKSSKRYQFSAVDPASRMGCIVTVGQVSLGLLLVFGLGLGLVYYSFQGQSDLAYSEPAPAIPAANTASSSTNTASSNSMSNVSGTDASAGNSSGPKPAATDIPRASPSPAPTTGTKVPPKTPGSDARPSPVAAATPKTARTIDSGMLNAKAISLPKPVFPRIQRDAHLFRMVKVHVLLDERGNVVSVEGLEGHPNHYPVAITAAKAARFRPTIVDGEPVKVRGFITYRVDP